MELNSNQIQAIIPHRYPFLLIDKIVDGEAGKWAKAIKCVSANEMHFCGHFPDFHVMPGVLIIEALAQTGAVALMMCEENKGKLGFLGGIKNARFRGMVSPGDVLELHCEIVNQKGAVGVGNGTATVNGKVVASATLTFALK